MSTLFHSCGTRTRRRWQLCRLCSVPAAREMEMTSNNVSTGIASLHCKDSNAALHAMSVLYHCSGAQLYTSQGAQMGVRRCPVHAETVPGMKTASTKAASRAPGAWATRARSRFPAATAARIRVCLPCPPHF